MHLHLTVNCDAAYLDKVHARTIREFDPTNEKGGGYALGGDWIPLPPPKPCPGGTEIALHTADAENTPAFLTEKK